MNIYKVIKKSVNRFTATDDSIIEVITVGRIESGKLSKLKRVKAGNTISVVKGVLLVSTKTMKVEQETRGPKWDYSSTGQKTLDLGFGVQQSGKADALTWAKLRAVSCSIKTSFPCCGMR